MHIYKRRKAEEAPPDMFLLLALALGMGAVMLKVRRCCPCSSVNWRSSLRRHPSWQPRQASSCVPSELQVKLLGWASVLACIVAIANASMGSADYKQMVSSIV